MATIQDVFSHIYTTEANLSSIAVKHGQIILCTDSEKLYIDHGSNRVSISDVVQVETQTALPLAPLDKFYITQDTGDVYFYINDEWKKLTDTIKDYTAFEVYANDSVIPPGEHEVLGTITVEIPVQMTETFALRTTTPEADSDVVIDWGDGTVQKVKDGEHGGYTGPDGEGRYIVKMTHTYAATGKYVVKVYGKDYFCLSHAPSHVSDASNMQCRILADDLPIASHLTNLTAFSYGTLKLVTVQCASYKYLHRTTNHAQMFTNDKNLLSVTGFEDLVMISRGAEGCFQFCENMHTCDFNGVLCSNNPRAMYAMFQNCYALSVDIGKFFPTKFVSRALNFTNTFTHMHAMTGTVDPNQFWGDPNIDWQGFSNCFYGCPEAIRSQVPTSWGGTSSTEIVGDLPVAKLSLNGTLPNTANGLLMLNASGKVDSSFLPPQAAVNIDNYTSNNTIKLTSTAGAVNLISNTTEAALYSGTAHVKANVDSVELQGTNLKFNNNAQNTAGGIVVVDTDTGKVPSSVLPEMGIDLTNYVTEENISLNAAGVASNATYKASSVMRIEGGTYTNIDTTAGPLNLGTSTSDVFLGGVGSNRNVTIQVTSISNLKLATGTNMDGSSANTANGFAIVGADGKLPASIVPETTGSVDLSAYNGLVGITTTGVSAISNGTSGQYKFTLGINSNGVILTEDGSARSVTVRSMKKISLEGGEISIIGYPFKIHSNGKLELSSSQDNIILNAQNSVDANIEMHGTGILWNGAALNTANGLVTLNGSGKIPVSLYDVTVDLTDYSVSENISIKTTGSSSTLTLDGKTINIGNPNANQVFIQGLGVSLKCGEDSVYISGGTATTTVVATEKFYVNCPGEFESVNFLSNVQINNHDLNTAQGLVQLDANGKVPESLLPEIGNASWTKVTINQSSFATSDDTYGGSYYELNGICSVEVYDANGYKVEFDVKCDFTNSKTRIYIPSGLTADTISNWTLLYLAKTIA